MEEVRDAKLRGATRELKWVDFARPMGEGGDVKWRVAVRQLKLVDVA